MHRPFCASLPIATATSATRPPGGMSRVGSWSLRSWALCFLLLPAVIGCSDDVKSDPADTGGATIDAGPIDTGEITDTDGEKDAGATDTASAADTGDCTADKECVDKLNLTDPCKEAICSKGVCKEADKSVGATCDDDKSCTDNDKCDAAGKCEGVVNCKGQECFDAICKSDGSCALTKIPLALKVKCDDGNECTSGDVCGQGNCSGTLINVVTKCNDNNSCTNDTCENDKGCVNTAKKAKTPCSDDDACTDKDTCDAKGACLAGKKVTCDDDDPCSDDICDKLKGCVYPAHPNGVTCNDKDKCTEKDECADGKCKGTLIAAAIPPNSCVLITCDPLTGQIKNKPASNGKPCSDDDPCTINDLCGNGICGGKKLICNDGNSCTADSCDKKTGSCVAPAQKDGLKCDDGDACTTKDACIKGKCTGEGYTTTGLCDDKTPCTNDGCSPQSGCFHVPKNGVFCDDGDKCTELDKCAAGKCKGAKTSCDDNKPCTNDTCDAKTGKCLHTAFTGPCDDGNKCTQKDLCTKGKCGGQKVTCNDNNPCTTDICDTLSGCKYIPLAGGSQCDDGVSCTLNDQCDLGKCTGTNTCVTCSSDLQCAKFDDNNPCNGVARCASSKLGNVCQIDPKSVVKCNPADDPACGTNQCNPQSGKCELLKKQKGVQCVSNNKCLASTVCSAAGTCEGLQEPLVPLQQL